MYIIATKKSKFIKDKFFEVSFRGDGDERVNRDDFDKLRRSRIYITWRVFLTGTITRTFLNG
jgi:hypothetical protein